MQTYERLNWRETRLAIILPGQWNDRLRCDLTTFDIDQTPKVTYKALSYVWGSPHTTEVMELRGENHGVTVNLACAIRHMRNREIPVNIWIDALCINQTDASEKGHQVALMRDIDAAAEEVVVFLGNGVDHRISKAYFTRPPPPPVVFWNNSRDDNHLRRFSDSLNLTQKDKSWNAFYAVCLVRSLSRECDAKAIIVEAKAPRPQDIFELLHRLTVEPWWQRIWVVQEIAIPLRATIRYGNVAAPWEMFVETAQAMISRPYAVNLQAEYSKVISLFARQVLDLENLRMEWKVSSGTDLLSLVRKFSDRKASIEHDRVCTLLGLANENCLLAPDYLKRIDQFYMQTAIALIRGHHNLSLLSGDLKRKKSQRKHLASWIPDWSAIVDESDRERIALQSVYNLSSGWRVTLVETEAEYWTDVAEQIDLLVKDLQKPDRRRRQISGKLRVALTDYRSYLTKHGSPHRQEVESLEEYFSTYNRNRRTTRGYKVNESNHLLYSEIVKSAKESFIGVPMTSFHHAFSHVVIEDAKGHKLQSEICRECKSLLRKMSRRPGPFMPFSQGDLHISMTAIEFDGRSIYTLGAAIVTVHRWLVKRYECLLVLLKPSTGPIEKIHQSCALILELTEEEDNTSTSPPSFIKTEQLFNFSIIFRGESAWMDLLMDPFRKAPRPEPIGPRSTHRSTRLKTESIPLAKVRWCGTKLTAWTDVDSGLQTVGIWMREVFRFESTLEFCGHLQRQKTMWCFMRTLIGGIRWKTGEVDRVCVEDYEPLSRWFKLSLLPRLCKAYSFDEEFTPIIDSVIEPCSSASSDESFDREMRLVTEGRVFFSDGRRTNGSWTGVNGFRRLDPYSSRWSKLRPSTKT